jgi:hypothetical protein
MRQAGFRAGGDDLGIADDCSGGISYSARELGGCHLGGKRQHGGYHERNTESKTKHHLTSRWKLRFKLKSKLLPL